MRRLSLKLTIDNLQEELMTDMGLEPRRMSSKKSVNLVMGNHLNNTADAQPSESIPLRRKTQRSQLHEEVLKTLQVGLYFHA